jgi:predicted phage terminase large subunit-like protein
MWPMWEWTTKPYTRWMFSSYALSLAIRDSLKCRRLIESEWYQSNWGHVFTMAKDQNLKSRFENDKRGYRLAVSVGSAATGEGGDRIVCDDPHNVVDAESQTIREGTLDWWDTTMSSRINNPKTGAKIIVMQRVHADDLSGHVLEQGGYIHLKLPAEYEPTTKCFTAIGWEDPRTDEGELLWPDRFSQESLDGIKRSLGSLGYAGQYQQAPTPSGGAIFKKQWFRYFTETPDAYVLQKTNGTTSILKSACWRFTVVDLAISSKQTADYTVIQTYDVTPHKDLILIDQIRDRMDNPEQLKTLKMVHARLRPMFFKVESIAYQLALTQQLKQVAIPVREYRPTRDKVSRASVAAILMENEKFFFRQGDPYLLVLEPELLMFPLGAHDDQVDDLSAAGDEVGMPHPTGGVYIPTAADLIGDDGESMALLEDDARW